MPARSEAEEITPTGVRFQDEYSFLLRNTPQLSCGRRLFYRVRQAHRHRNFLRTWFRLRRAACPAEAIRLGLTVKYGRGKISGRFGKPDNPAEPYSRGIRNFCGSDFCFCNGFFSCTFFELLRVIYGKAHVAYLIGPTRSRALKQHANGM